MHKLIIFSCVFTIFFYETFGAVGIVPANPKYPGKCFYEQTGVMEPNEEKYLKDCGKATCSSNGQIQLVSCGVISVDESRCKLVQNLEKNYPDCCPQPKCH